jgi:hypothetical protein
VKRDGIYAFFADASGDVSVICRDDVDIKEEGITRPAVKKKTSE